MAKIGRTDYVGTNMEFPSRDQIEAITKARWSIEIYLRELKQTCRIERCQARTSHAQRNHIFLFQRNAVYFGYNLMASAKLVHYKYK